LVRNKKQAVLKGAELLFSEKGFNETTVSDLSKTSGVHEASIYSYFGNKKNILFKLQSNYLEKAIKSLNEHFRGMKEPGPKLRKAIWHYLSDMINNPACALTLMLAMREKRESHSSKDMKLVNDYSELILQIVKDGQSEGFFRNDVSAVLIKNMAIGTSVFASFNSVVNKAPFDPDEMSDTIFQLVYNATAAIKPLEKVEPKIKKGERTLRRRNQIIKSAQRVYSEMGFSTATISEVARDAGLGDATLYEYFESKEAILLAIAENHFCDLSPHKDIRVEGFPEPEKKLRLMIWNWIQQTYTHQEFTRILTLDLSRNLNFFHSLSFQYIKQFWDNAEEAIIRGRKEGIFRDNVPLPTFYQMIRGTLDQYHLSQFLFGTPPLGISELNDLVNAFIRAIKKQIS